MASEQRGGSSMDDHDWHSNAYVERWIARDAARDVDRRRSLQRMIAFAPFQADAEIRVLDVGGGYGMVTEEVLAKFPRARVTLQDYSAPMIAQARQRLSRYASQMTYVLCDLVDPAWPSKTGGPFDLAVSAIALHNLRDPELIKRSYQAICGLLAPGGVFLDYDHFHRIGTAEANVAVLRTVGFEEASCPWKTERDAILKAVRGSTASASARG